MNPLLSYIVADLLGLNTRYLIYKLIGKPKTRKFLKGDSKDVLSTVDQHFTNGLTGFIVLAIILYLSYFFLL